MSLALAAAMAASLSVAQAQPSDAQKTFESTLGAIQSTWNRVLREGRPMAERLVNQAPGYYKGLRKRADDLLKKAQTFADPATMEQRKALLIELWRVRQGLDIVALLRPETIEFLTGLDVRGLDRMRLQIVKAIQHYQTPAKKPV